MHSEKFDAIIIGAGLVGLFTALHLRKLGVERIAVFDQNNAGGVASPRAGGLIRRHYNHPLLVELAQLGLEQYSKLSESTGNNVGFRRSGYLLVVKGERADLVESNVRMQRELGVDTSILSTSQLAAEFSEFRHLGNDVLTVHERDSAFADPPATVAAVVSAVRQQKVAIYEGTTVHSIQATNGQVTGVVTSAGDFAGEVVVNAAGAWGASVARAVGIDLPVEVKRLLQIIQVKSGPTNGLRSLSHESADLYARAHSPSSVLVGGRHYFGASVDPDSVKLLPVLEKAEQLHSSYGSMVQLELGQIMNGWAGIDGDTPDYQPILGPIPNISGFYCATGFSGHGFKLAPIAGQLVAEHITTGRYQTLDARPLGFERFAQGKLFELGHKQMGA